MESVELAGSRPQADPVKDGTEATFMSDVIDGSRTAPVIVDFWAPWCGPCKTLGPALEQAVRAAGGAVKMVKINIDEAKSLASQMRIQSIPTVLAFLDGQPVDGFQGAVPPSEIKAFVDRVVATAGGEPSGMSLDEGVAEAERLLESGAAVDAAQAFAAVLSQDPAHAGAFGGMARAHIALGDLDQAEAILNGAPADISEAAEIEAAFAQLALARQAADAGPVADLLAAVEANPGDHQSRFDLALALHASGKVEDAVGQLLELFRRDRKWNEEAAKTQLLTIFDSLKPNDPVALDGRRQLSSLIFA